MGGTSPLFSLEMFVPPYFSFRKRTSQLPKRIRGFAEPSPPLSKGGKGNSLSEKVKWEN